MVRITMQNGKTIDIELDATAAPITCENFLKLVNQGFYNGHPHREVIQEMQDEGIDFYRTDLYGTVTVTAQADGSFTVQTAKQPDEELAPAA